MNGDPLNRIFFFFNDTATTEIYTLSLHDALPIFTALGRRSGDPADIREAPVYLLLGLALGSVWSRTDDQRVDPGGSGPSHRCVGRAQRSPCPRESPRTSHSHLCTKV